MPIALCLQLQLMHIVFFHRTSMNVIESSSMTNDEDENDDEDTNKMERGYENDGLKSLNSVNKTLAPIWSNGCCGLGHRLSSLIPTLVYANQHNRKAQVYWPDVSWGDLFEENEYFESSSTWLPETEGLCFANANWKKWTSSNPFPTTGTVLDRYPNMHLFLSDNGWVYNMLNAMRSSFTPLIKTYFDSIHEGLRGAKHVSPDKQLSLCVHVREGNGETGDWASKKWRHVGDLSEVVNAVVKKMKLVASSKNATSVSVFVASDNAAVVRPAFAEAFAKNSKAGNDTEDNNRKWSIIKPKEIHKPENGVWFGEHGSNTSHVLNQTMKTEAMAEAISQVFGLGECDALFVPTYSTFNLPAIILTRGRNKDVYVGRRDKDQKIEMIEIKDLHLPVFDFEYIDKLGTRHHQSNVTVLNISPSKTAEAST